MIITKPVDLIGKTFKLENYEDVLPTVHNLEIAKTIFEHSQWFKIYNRKTRYSEPLFIGKRRKGVNNGI